VVGEELALVERRVTEEVLELCENNSMGLRRCLEYLLTRTSYASANIPSFDRELRDAEELGRSSTYSSSSHEGHATCRWHECLLVAGIDVKILARFAALQATWQKQ
jgi:hypothetical protein